MIKVVIGIWCVPPFRLGTRSQIDSASRVRAPQLFPIYEACGYSLCLANQRTCNAPEHFPTGIQQTRIDAVGRD